MHRLRQLALAAAAALALVHGSALAAEKCYDFSGLDPGATWGVDATVQIDIGEIRVRPLVLDGVIQAAGNEANRFFKVAPSGQSIAGGQAPEVYAKNASIQMLPRDEVHKISLRYSHQPGADGVRAAMVEVNGVRHDWQGSIHKLDGRQIGARHAARFAVRQADGNGSNGWISGELKLTSQDGIKSFTLGAAELRLDDVCVER